MNELRAQYGLSKTDPNPPVQLGSTDATVFSQTSYGINDSGIYNNSDFIDHGLFSESTSVADPVASLSLDDFSQNIYGSLSALERLNLKNYLTFDCRHNDATADYVITVYV